MTIEGVFQAICERPEDDDARLHYADLCESSDPDHAAYIRATVADVVRRRHGLQYEQSETWVPLLRRNKERWAHNLLRFLPPQTNSDGSIDTTANVRFDRGFPVGVTIHPHVFLEYGDLLFRLAPIRHVRFTRPYDLEQYLPPWPDESLLPFPLDEILAMPQLSRLDSFGFELNEASKILPEDTWTKVAQCPYLTRCRVLDTRGASVYPEIEALAAGPLTGKMLRLDPYGTGRLFGEWQHSDIDSVHGEHTVTTFDETGLKLEEKYGYIPWLHPSHCKGDLEDIAYFVQQGDLPKYKPGTPPMKEWYEFPIKIHARQPSREW